MKAALAAVIYVEATQEYVPRNNTSIQNKNTMNTECLSIFDQLPLKRSLWSVY